VDAANEDLGSYITTDLQMLGSRNQRCLWLRRNRLRLHMEFWWESLLGNARTEE